VSVLLKTYRLALWPQRRVRPFPEFLSPVPNLLNEFGIDDLVYQGGENLGLFLRGY
jgi:hypothetical protein